MPVSCLLGSFVTCFGVSSVFILSMIQYLKSMEMLIYCVKNVCFDNFKTSITMNNSSSVRTFTSSCIIFKSALSFGNQTNMTLACLLRFFVMAE